MEADVSGETPFTTDIHLSDADRKE
jgi:hypothetical protein